MKFGCCWLFFVVFLFLYPPPILSKLKPRTPAVPRPKKVSAWARGLVKSVLREVKCGFSSDLEAVTLRVTRPSDYPVPQSSLQLLSEYVSISVDEPEQIVELLIKLSRKWTETDPFTKLKALLALHSIIATVEHKQCMVLTHSLKSLRAVVDTKVKDRFFSVASLAPSQLAISTADEQLRHLTRQYYDYVFSFAECKLSVQLALGREKRKKRKAAAVQGGAEKNKGRDRVGEGKSKVVDKALRQLAQTAAMADAVCQSCQKSNKVVCGQVLSRVTKDRRWIESLSSSLQEQASSHPAGSRQPDKQANN